MCGYVEDGLPFMPESRGSALTVQKRPGVRVLTVVRVSAEGRAPRRTLR